MPIDLVNLSIYISVCTTFTAVYLIILALSKREESLEKKLRRFTARRAPAASTSEKKDLKHLLTLLGGLTPKRWQDGLDRQLIRADIPLKGGEFLVLQAFLVLLFFTIGLLLTNLILVGLATALLGGFLPRLWLKGAQKKKRRCFNNQLADALLILANSLRAGFSLLQAMEMVSQEMQNPIAGELKITLREMTYGSSTENALVHLAERVGSQDLDLLVTAVLIQRQVGGNLAEVLMNIHGTIQDRLKIQQEIKTLTAQGRMSGYIIAGLPFGIALIMTILNPSYLKLLITTPLGLGLLGSGFASQIIGFLIIRKIITVEA